MDRSNGNGTENDICDEGRSETVSWLGLDEEKVVSPLFRRGENSPRNESEDVTLPPVLCQLPRSSANYAATNEAQLRNGTTQASRIRNQATKLQPAILSWNIQGIQTGRQDLDLIIKDRKPLVICLQETMCSQRTQPRITGYTIYNRPRPNCQRASGGVLIAVKNGIDNVEIEMETTLEAIKVNIGPPLNFSIINVYFPPGANLNISEVEALFAGPNPVLLVGDINAHHPVWGSSFSNKRGKELEEVFDKNDLVILNSGEPTYYNQTTGKGSCIDVAVCSTHLAGNLEWEVLGDSYGSDHMPTLICNPRETQENPTRPKWKIQEADWEQYQRIVDFPLIGDPEEQMKGITSGIISAAEQSIPRTKGAPSRRVVPWWNDEVHVAVKKRRTALRRMKSAPSDERREELARDFKTARREARQVIKSAKEESWKQFVSSFNVHTSVKDMWNKYRSLQGRCRQACIGGIKYEGREETTSVGIAEAIAEAFCSVSSDTSYSEHFRDVKQQTESNPFLMFDAPEEEYNKDFSMYELDEALESLKDSAPGEDNVHYGMLSNLPLDCKYKLLETYNKLWQQSVYPVEWTKSIVIPIYKGKGDRTNPLNYRPIYLNSCVAKILEKMVNSRLIFILETKKLLHKYQYGFRKAKSTTDHLVELEGTIREHLNKGHYAQAVFLDKSKAYDTTWRRLILEKLKFWKIGGHLLRFIERSLACRTFRVLANGTLSSEKKMENGLCQGSVLSVTLFLVAINTIVEKLPGEVKCLIYADDVVIIYGGNDFEKNEEILQNALNTISDWQQRTGFNVSAEKCATVTFKTARARKVPLTSSLTINGSKIPKEKTFKCLGVWFDQSLRFREHVENIRASCQQRMKILKCVASSSWGGDRETICKLYKATILEKMLYAAPLISSVSKDILKKLEVVHNAGMRAISGAFRSSPSESIRAEAGMPSFNTYVDQRTALYAVKLKALDPQIIEETCETTSSEDESQETTTYESSSGEEWGSVKPVPELTIRERGGHLLQELEVQVPLLNIFTLPSCAPWKRKKILVDKTLYTAMRRKQPEIMLRKLFNERRVTKYRVHKTLYTDGSKMSNKCGYSVVSDNMSIRKRIYDESSIYGAESLAAKEAIMLVANEEGAGAYLICTDSLSVVTCLESSKVKSLWKDQMLEIYTQCLQNRKEVTFFWVPSHIGIEGNEKADREAKLALEQRIDTSIALDYKEMKKILNNKIIIKWQYEWGKIRENKLREVKDSVIPYKTRGKTRRENVVLTRIRIGHTVLTHKHLFERMAAPMCQWCNELLTVKHLLVECISLDEERKKVGLPISLREILADDEERIESVICYLKNINVYNSL